VKKPEGKRPLGRPRRSWLANIKVDLKRNRMEWYGPMEGFCESGNISLGSIKYWKILEWLSDWQLHKKGSAPCG
jgi:hypothetical protein